MFKVLKVHRDPHLSDRKVLKDLLAFQESKDHKGLKEFKALKAHREYLLLVLKDPKVL